MITSLHNFFPKVAHLTLTEYVVAKACYPDCLQKQCNSVIYERSWVQAICQKHSFDASHVVGYVRNRHTILQQMFHIRQYIHCSDLGQRQVRYYQEPQKSLKYLVYAASVAGL